MKRFLLLLLLCMIPSAFATIDLVGPVDSQTTNGTTIDFEYYASIDGLLGCTVTVGPQAFPDPDVENNAMNEVQVQNVAPGTYVWNITCTGTQDETSAGRTFTIDPTPPTLAIITPAQGATIETLAVDFIPNDDTSTTLTCDILWNDVELDAVSVGANSHHVATYTGAPGDGTLTITCTDDAGNQISQVRQATLEPELYFTLTTDKTTYGIEEPILLKVDTLPGADVTIDVCPNTQGFVQCTTALIDSTTFPQTITLPYMNKTGEYLVDGLLQYGDRTAVDQALYSIENTMVLTVDKEGEDLGETITLTATASGGVGPYLYTWTLSNGTTRTTSSVDVLYTTPGAYSVSVTATDAAGNTKSETIPIDIEAIYPVTVIVVDDTTGTPIVNAEVDFDNKEQTTIADGSAVFSLNAGKRQLFVSAAGYDYYIGEYKINTTHTFTVRMTRAGTAPTVMISEPTPGVIVGIPTRIAYTATYNTQLTCTLLQRTDADWYAENGSMTVQSGQHEFLREYPVGEHTVQIECVDAQGKTGTAAPVTFTVKEGAAAATPVAVPTTTEEEIGLQDLADEYTAILAGLDGYGAQERTVAELIGFDKQLRNTKRAILQAIRDIDALNFRSDLDDAGRERERTIIFTTLDTLVQTTPVAFEITDTNSFVKYVEEDDIAPVAEELMSLEGWTQNAKRLQKQLLEDQQKFTISSKVYTITYTLADGENEVVTLITRSFTYANDLDPGYGIIEIIPKSIANDAEEITLITKGEVLKDDPILRFQPKKEIVYAFPKKIPLTKIESINTVFAREYTDTDGTLTGLAVFGNVDVSGYGMYVIILVAILILAYLIYYFDFLQQIKYVLYRFRKNEKVHYVRVLINDADDQLGAQDYSKAELLYKEVRMTYDTLSELERNDLYEDVMMIVHKMDAYYFNLVMTELDKHIKAGDLDNAITEYEKLVGTFERLDDERKKQLVDTVTLIAKRLGVAA